MIEKKFEYALHPGVILKDFLSNIKMKQKELADKLEMQPSQLSEIINGKRNISAEIAVKLEPVFGLSAKFWMRLQSDYDVYMQKEKGFETVEMVTVVEQAIVPQQISMSKTCLLAA